jgi:predicted transcriptional regulator
MLKRRPCSLNDISIGLGMNRNEALKYITTLVKQDKITAEQVADKTFYKAI